jgi:hypothetical protein
MRRLLWWVDIAILAVAAYVAAVIVAIEWTQ